MAHPDQPQRTLSASDLSARQARRALLALAAAIVVLLIGYLAFAVPASWFASSPVKEWRGDEITVPRGVGSVVAKELVIAGADPSGQVFVSVTTNFAARDYATIAWTARNVAPEADVRFLWRSDVAPSRIFSTPVSVEAGHLLPVLLANNSDWLGHITGIGLAIHDKLAQPLVISNVAAKPSGAVGILRDRAGDWLEFERWSGASINTIVGGNDVQPLPLPLLLAASIALAALALFGWRRFHPPAPAASLAVMVAVMFAASWFLLDARWMWNLARQVGVTTAQYGGKDWREKHLAAEDAPLFDFVEKARSELPATPVRIFVASESDYLRQRAAFHLYPHNVLALPRDNKLPGTDQLKPGDYLLVFQRRGVQFDPSTGNLRWDGGKPISAQMKVRVPGAALFLIQ